MPAAEWAAPSIARMRSWRWRALRWTVDSIRGPEESGGYPASKVYSAFPVEIGLTFGIMGDTAHVLEDRLMPMCMSELRTARPVWWMAHVLTATPSGWRQIRTQSGMARTSCK